MADRTIHPNSGLADPLQLLDTVSVGAQYFPPNLGLVLSLSQCLPVKPRVKPRVQEMQLVSERGAHGMETLLTRRIELPE